MPIVEMSEWNDTVTRFCLKDLRFTLNEALVVLAVVAASVVAAGVCESVHSFYIFESVLTRTRYSAHSRLLAVSFQRCNDIMGLTSSVSSMSS
jgi:hypothetical protein